MNQLPIHSGKTVVVADPIWAGHHPLYLGQFTASFIRLGAHVVALCPDPDDARREILDTVPAHVAANLDQHVSFGTLEPAHRGFLNGRFEGDPYQTTYRWFALGRKIRSMEKQLGRTIDFVYLPYLDTYLRFLPLPIIPEIMIGKPWSGLYLRNHHHANPSSLKQDLVLLGKGDALLRSESCKAVGVLDERFILKMERHTGKSIHMIPEFANISLPPEPTPFASEIMKKAAGRKIIGMIGLERRKGIVTLLKVARMAQQQNLPYYFVCGGMIQRHEYSDAEWKEVNSLVEDTRDNLHIDLEAPPVKGEAIYNSLFSTFSIAWVAYENFQGSSNNLSKAAAFQIPCLASIGGCIGHRVEDYGTGLAIPEGDAERALEAIPLLLAGKDWSGSPLPHRYADFRNDHSHARLDALLSEVISR